MDNNPALCEAIEKAIAASPQQRISFADYMELALYHPQYGYYTTGAGKIGGSGDFVTSPHLCPDFGELLAEQFVNIWEIMGKKTPFQLVEMGAGQGLIAGDVLAYLQRQYPDFFKIIEYTIVEKSPAMKQYQQSRLAKWSNRLHWLTWEEIAPESIVGCCFSNELVDALPVHQFLLENGQLKEIYVTTDLASSFIEIAAEPSTSRIAEYFALTGIHLLPRNAGAPRLYPDGYRSEVHLAALDWLEGVALRLKKGYLLTVDYGYPAQRYYSPQRHKGTLQCYYQHRHHDNPYLYVGKQDITAHVNFTALERQGESCGLERVGFIQQGLFLMALGLGDRIAALSTTTGLDISTVLQRREVLHGLIDPTGLGGFGVLVQSKGLREGEQKQSLKGLTMP